MAPPSADTIALARSIRDGLAGSGLGRPMARLYSQHTLLASGGGGLRSWQNAESQDRLDEARRLIEVGFVLRDAGDVTCVNALRRAGELLEWVSHEQLNPEGLPTGLLAAAVYQLAGYPARASGVLRSEGFDGPEAGIVRALLAADFPGLFRLLSVLWSQGFRPEQLQSAPFPWDDPTSSSEQLRIWLLGETAGALGVLCGYLRWGDDSRVERALAKLRAIGKVFLHGNDPHSWMLAKLTAEVAMTFMDSCMRRHATKLVSGMSSSGGEAIESYLRQAYRARRAIAWPSQIRGIEQLAEGGSFALCTPTGSGKTTIAELAILQSLFPQDNDHAAPWPDNGVSPLAIYLVPSRALAAEVEAKLASVLSRLRSARTRVVVTGLYGGIDWGPTDVWLTSEERTVLICTYEKGEALMRFLGPLFLGRVSLVVVDEAHSIQFDGNRDRLLSEENRALRLESLSARLLAYLEDRSCRIIALSAVAGAGERSLAQWVAGREDAEPVRTDYRSTRQLIGRLECQPNGGFEVRYDLLDRSLLRFSEDGPPEAPYIPSPFPPHPPAPAFENTGPEKLLRPYLFWAAMHLASPDDQGQQHAVLISITQKPGGYAEDLLSLLETAWAQATTPSFFQPPSRPSDQTLLDKCLRACEDYFTRGSREYRLLEKGIVVHHGKMPGLLARLLVEAIQRRIVHLVLATSTLSEGVNLPFETILIPSLRRGVDDLTLREFSNLVGRAGRPGFGTEGRTLILLGATSLGHDDKTRRSLSRTRRNYLTWVERLANEGDDTSGGSDAISSLAELIRQLELKWQSMSGLDDHDVFLEWLEVAAPLSPTDPNFPATGEVMSTLDILDAVLLPGIVELEQLAGEELDSTELESRLKGIWNHAYARYASEEEERLQVAFVRRGVALKTRVYPDTSFRQRIYRTAVSPRSARELLDIYPAVRQHLVFGGAYPSWSTDERFTFIETLFDQIGAVSRFGVKPTVGRNGSGPSWNDVLRWWMDPHHAARIPTPNQTSDWYNFVSTNFTYRFNWGLSSVIGLAMAEGTEAMTGLTLEDFPRTGLPWIAFWIKELVTWGTMEPVAAYLLSRRLATTRAEAEVIAQEYYSSVAGTEGLDDILNAQAIRNWAAVHWMRFEEEEDIPPDEIGASLLRDFQGNPNTSWRVVPVLTEERLLWVDPAGFALAESGIPDRWQHQYSDLFDFVLDPAERLIRVVAHR